MTNGQRIALSGCWLLFSLAAFAQYVYTSPPISLTVTPSATTVRAGGTVQLTVSAMAPVTASPYLPTQNSTITFTLTATGGTLSNPSTTLSNTQVYTWTAPQINGTYTIMTVAKSSGLYMTVPPASILTQIIVINGITQTNYQTLTMSLNPSTIDVTNGSRTSTITVSLAGRNVAGQSITLTSGWGTIQPTTIPTSANGQGTATITVPQGQMGQLDILGYTGNVSASAILSVTSASAAQQTTNSPGVTVQAIPSPAPADGATMISIYAHFTNNNGVPLVNIPITFQTNAGVLTMATSVGTQTVLQTITDPTGSSSVSLIAPPPTFAGGTILVTVTGGGLSGSVAIPTIAPINNYLYPLGTVYPPVGTVYPPIGTVYPPVGTVYPPIGTTYPPYGTTYPPYGTTYPSTGTTYPPYGTTYPPTGTTYPPTGTVSNPNGTKPPTGTTTNTGSQTTPQDNTPPRVRGPFTIAEVMVSAAPTEVEVTDSTKIRIDATVIGSDNTTSAAGAPGSSGFAAGQAMSNVPVTFSTTAGKLDTALVNTDTDGHVHTNLLAPDTPGTVTVTATAGNVSGTVAITVNAAPSVYIPLPPNTSPANNLGQTNTYVSGDWMDEQFPLTGGAQPVISHTLAILDQTTGKTVKEIDMGTTGCLIHDQYGLARGYVTVSDEGKARMTFLNDDGTQARELLADYDAGSRVVDAREGDPSGNLAVVVTSADGTKSWIHEYDLTGTDMLKAAAILSNGLPLIAMTGEGDLGIALPSGEMQGLDANGKVIIKGTRTDNMPATAIAIGPDGAWVAVASADDPQTGPGKLTAIVRDADGPPIVFNVVATRLFPAGDHNIIVSSTDSTINVDLTAKKAAWDLKGGGAECFLMVGDPPNQMGIIAGLSDAKLNMINRVIVMDMATQKILGEQNFGELGSIAAILPPDKNGSVQVICAHSIIKFNLPSETTTNNGG